MCVHSRACRASELKLILVLIGVVFHYILLKNLFGPVIKKNKKNLTFYLNIFFKCKIEYQKNKQTNKTKQTNKQKQKKNKKNNLFFSNCLGRSEKGKQTFFSFFFKALLSLLVFFF